jgi:hypothetical protein
MSTTWSISQLDRELPDGLVTNAHWRCTVTDGEQSASTFGSVGLERGETFTPYEELTEEQVLGWVKPQLEVADIEAGLQSHLDAQKNPVTATGVPWSTPSVTE